MAYGELRTPWTEILSSKIRKECFKEKQLNLSIDELKSLWWSVASSIYIEQYDLTVLDLCNNYNSKEGAAPFLDIFKKHAKCCRKILDSVHYDTVDCNLFVNVIGFSRNVNYLKKAKIKGKQEWKLKMHLLMGLYAYRIGKCDRYQYDVHPGTVLFEQFIFVTMNNSFSVQWMYPHSSFLAVGMRTM